jgi:hypothetical protein
VFDLELRQGRSVVSQSRPENGILALQRRQPIAQIQNDGNASNIDSQMVAQPANHLQARHSVFIEEQFSAFASARFNQPAFDKALDESRVDTRAFGKRLYLQPPLLMPGKNNFIPDKLHRFGINSRALKCDSPLSFSKSSFSLAVSRGGLTILIFAY